MVELHRDRSAGIAVRRSQRHEPPRPPRGRYRIDRRRRDFAPPRNGARRPPERVRRVAVVAARRHVRRRDAPGVGRLRRRGRPFGDRRLAALPVRQLERVPSAVGQEVVVHAASVRPVARLERRAGARRLRPVERAGIDADEGLRVGGRARREIERRRDVAPVVAEPVHRRPPLGDRARVLQPVVLARDRLDGHPRRYRLPVPAVPPRQRRSPVRVPVHDHHRPVRPPADPEVDVVEREFRPRRAARGESQRHGRGATRQTRPCGAPCLE